MIAELKRSLESKKEGPAVEEKSVGEGVVGSTGSDGESASAEVSDLGEREASGEQGSRGWGRQPLC